MATQASNVSCKQQSTVTSKSFNQTTDLEKTLYRDYIEPVVLKRFPNAKVILLGGSQGRALSNGTHLPQKNSDYDFVILYDTFDDDEIESAMFSCEKLHVPEHDRIISIDYKVFDRAGYNDHVEETVNVRRFPFLFNMIADGHAVKGDDRFISALKKSAVVLTTKGPSPLSCSQMQSEIQVLERFIENVENAQTHDDVKDLALEYANLIPQDYLRLNRHWESGTNRVFQYLEEIDPDFCNDVIRGYSRAITHSDITMMTTITHDILDKYKDIVAQRNDVSEDATADNVANDNKAVISQVAKIKSQSDKNLCRIMIDQYLDRLEIAETRGFGYMLGTQSALWGMTKKISSLIGTDKSESQKETLRDFMNAVIVNDNEKCRELAEVILGPVGGLQFNYLERHYTDDLAKRLQKKLAIK